MKNLKIAILLFLGAYALPVSSQSVLGWQYPFGIPIRPGTGPSLSMGGVGTAVDNDLYGMSENPANLGVMNRAIFSGLLSLQYLRIDDNDEHSLHISFDPQSFFFGFPLAKYGTIGFVMSQLSKTDLNYINKGSINEFPLGEVIEGGTVGWQGGYGLTIFKKLRLGISYERLYFRNATTRFKINTAADSLFDSTSTLISVNGFNAGAMYSINNVTLGISGKAYSKGTAEYYNQNIGTQRYTDTTYDTSSTEPILTTSEKINSTNSTGKVTLPPGISFGMSYKITPEWLLATDIDMILWQKYQSDRPSQTEKTIELTNAINLSLGTQYIPAPNLLTPRYYEIIQYRAGYRFTKLPGSQAYETAITLGTGLPLKKGGGIFDLFIETGRRWDKKYTGYSENFFSLQIGLNGGQKWFQSSDEGY